MLAAAVVALLLHAVAVGIVFLILMVVCGIAALIVVTAAYSRSKSEQAALMRDEMARLRRGPGGGAARG